MPKVYDEGDIVTVSVTYRDADGDLFDPIAVHAAYIPPDGDQAVSEGALTPVSPGVYEWQISATQGGVWQYRFQATGVGVEERYFSVRPSNFEDFP